MSHPPSQSDGSPANSSYADNMQGPPRKKMRKGTKSCLECRRRKIKCTFESGRTAICNECYARGSTCIDQEHGDIQSYTQQTAEQSSYSLRERVTQLEGLVKQVLNHLPDKQGRQSSDPQFDRSQVDAQAAEVLKSLKTGPAPTSPSATEDHSIFLPVGVRSEAPALTLFDNDVISRKESQPALSRAQYNKNKTLIAALTQMLPSPHDLELILEQSHEWWVIWRTMFPEISDKRCETMKESVSHSLRSDKPAEIAKIMLCIAISLHQMPQGFDWDRLHLKETRQQLMEKYISTVDKLIVADDEIAATVDGIECMMPNIKPTWAGHVERGFCSIAPLPSASFLASIV
jgi:Fungal Zn(2)-Cys(6) binuclear cluster domain